MGADNLAHSEHILAHVKLLTHSEHCSTEWPAALNTPESNLSSCTSLAGYRNSAGTRSWLLRCPFSSPDHFVKAFDHLSHPGVALSRAGRAIEPSLDAQLPAQSNAPGSQKKKCQQRHFHAAPAALHRRCGSHMGSYAFAESLNLWSLSDWSQATTLRTYHLAVIPSVAFTESLGAQAAPQVHSSSSGSLLTHSSWSTAWQVCEHLQTPFWPLHNRTFQSLSHLPCKGITTAYHKQ